MGIEQDIVRSRDAFESMLAESDECHPDPNNKEEAKKKSSGGNPPITFDKEDVVKRSASGDLANQPLELKDISAWGSEETALFFRMVGCADKFAHVKSGAELVAMEDSDQAVVSLAEKEPVKGFMFMTYLQYIKQCVRAKTRFSLKFPKVLDKMMKVGDVLKDWAHRELAVMCSLLSDKSSIEKHFLESKESKASGGNAKARMKIKLIITETTFNDTKRWIRKLVSPIVRNIKGLNQPFGLFHSALLVGPYYLEWTDSQLIIPKAIKSGSAYLSIDVPHLLLNTPLNNKIIKEILAEIIEKWNVEYTYSSIADISKKKGNCQTFINDVCDALNIKIALTGCMKDFIDNLSKSGECNLVFSPSEDFARDFKLSTCKMLDKFKTKTGYKITFDKHSTLDDFCFHCFKANVEGYLSYQAEYTLLKAFDRAFWLRHLKNVDDENYKPSPCDQSISRQFGTLPKYFTGCPFMHPGDSKSFQGV